MFVAAFLCIVTIQAVAQQNTSLLIRVVLIRLPLSLLLSGVGIEIVAMLLHATDVMAATLLQTSARPGATLVAGISAILVGSSIASPALAGFEGLAFSLILAVVAFVCWLELVVRAAAITMLRCSSRSRGGCRSGRQLNSGFADLSRTVCAHHEQGGDSRCVALAVISMGTAQGVNMLVEGIVFVLCAGRRSVSFGFYHSSRQVRLDTWSLSDSEAVRHYDI